MQPKIKKLSNDFFFAYPHNVYPGIEQDEDRPYVLLVFSINSLFLCVPFRTNISHNNSYLFRNSSRSVKNKSGIDYSKTLVLNNLNYLEGNQVVDQDEYNETAINFEQIKREITEYVNKYVNHHNNFNPLHSREYQRLFRYTTLKYFHELLGL